jgi:xanthine dehydrogenase accessory factor
VTPAILAQLLAAKRAGQATVLATRMPDGRQFLLPCAEAPPLPGAMPQGLAEAAALALQRDESRLAEVGDETWFLHVHAPPYRLLIVGAVHIAQVLAPLASLLGIAVTVIDPRRSFANEQRFPGVALSLLWPDEAIAALGPDPRSAIVTLTHDPKLDDPALDRALQSDAFFIGALGSRKTHATRLERLAARGHKAEALARIRGPVGLPLGAVAAQEIALSIVAEIVAVRRGAALAGR